MTEPIPEKKSQDEVPEGFSPEEGERLRGHQDKLTDFILHLIQAFLRTGYYTAEHPESKKAKEGLYQQFKTLFDQEDELTFLSREEQDQQEILVEGVLPEPQILRRMMLKGMGELYVPKFVKYFERKDLISLTLMSRMDQTEFSRFIDIMSEPSFLDTRRKEDKERFAEALRDDGIFNISLVYDEELLGSEREMAWRARVTISRMRKDLKMVPYFQNMTGQEVREIRRKLLRDSLRPVRRSDILYAVLQNSDLAATLENSEEVIEDEITSFLEKQYLLGTSRIFLREYLALKKLPKQGAPEEKPDRLLKKVTHRLKEAGTQEAENLLEEYFRHQLVGLDDLTPGLKDKILLQRLTDRFLDFTDQFFQRLDQAKEKETFLETSLSFVKMIPELIRRDRYPEILRIFETLKQHFHQKKMWALLAGQVLEEAATGEVPLLLREKFQTGKKEVRTAIIPIFASLEIGAIPHLLAILKTSEDQWVRKNACEALIEIGPVAAAHLLQELEQQSSSVETACDILRVLEKVRSQEWKALFVRVLKKYACHEHPRLRERALHTLCQIGTDGVEDIFLSSLKDPDLEVRKRAIWCLGMIRSAKGIETMLGMLDQISAGPSPERDQLETQIYYALGISGNLTIRGKTLEEFLLEVLAKRGARRWFGRFEKNPLSDSALEAVCGALGKIGTLKSVQVLTGLARSREKSWAPAAVAALGKIEERQRPSIASTEAKG